MVAGAYMKYQSLLNAHTPLDMNAYTLGMWMYEYFSKVTKTEHKNQGG
jgi:hypothetical protein